MLLRHGEIVCVVPVSSSTVLHALLMQPSQTDSKLCEGPSHQHQTSSNGTMVEPCAVLGWELPVQAFTAARFTRTDATLESASRRRFNRSRDKEPVLRAQSMKKPSHAALKRRALRHTVRTPEPRLSAPCPRTLAAQHASRFAHASCVSPTRASTERSPDDVLSRLTSALPGVSNISFPVALRW